MIKEEATPLVLDLANSFMTLVQQIDPSWSKAFFRFCSHGTMREAKASYVHKSGVALINVVKHKDFFHPVVVKGQELLACLGKDKGVFLLVVDSEFNYEIKFEYQDMDRWRINKMNGGTGIPEGIE